jgi:heat shock protein HslJ
MAAASGVPATLAGTAWRAVTVSGAEPVPGREPTIRFEEERLNGSTGCNQFFGGYTYADGTIAVSQVGMTMMACDDAVGTIESAFLTVLNGATSASIEEAGQLLLGGLGGEILFAPEAPAEG